MLEVNAAIHVASVLCHRACSPTILSISSVAPLAGASALLLGNMFATSPSNTTALTRDFAPTTRPKRCMALPHNIQITSIRRMEIRSHVCVFEKKGYRERVWARIAVAPMVKIMFLCGAECPDQAGNKTTIIFFVFLGGAWHVPRQGPGPSRMLEEKAVMETVTMKAKAPFDRHLSQ